MEMNSVEALLIEQLKDLYSAEAQLLKALPKMARRASDPSLRESFDTHTEETRTHVERLQEIGESLGLRLGGKKCKAMEGLVEEGSEVFEMEGEDAIIDAALIAAAQRIEHYEISAYGTARTLAERVGEQQLVDLLQQTLDEEYATDEKLTQISEGELLANAPVRAGMVEDEGEGGDFMSESGEYDEEGEQEFAGASGRRSGSRGSQGSGRSGGSRGQSRGTSSRSGSSGSSGGSYSSSRGGSGGSGSSRSSGNRSGSRSGGSSGSSRGGGSSSRSNSSRSSGSSRSGSSSGSRGGSSRSGSSGGNRGSGSRSGAGSMRSRSGSSR